MARVDRIVRGLAGFVRLGGDVRDPISHRRLTPLLDPVETVAFWLTHPAARATAVERLEAAIAARLGARHVIATSSGRVALWAILRALDLPARATAWLPVNTYDGLLPGIRDCGVEPRFVDVLPDHNLDPDALEAGLARATGPGLVLATHMFGLPCDIEAVASICSRNGMFLVEDCAHAFHVRTPLGVAGLAGAAGLLSFQSRKAVNALGGGAVVTQDDRLATRARQALAGLSGAAARPTLLIAQHLADSILSGRGYPAARLVFEDARLFRRVRGTYTSMVQFSRGASGLSSFQAMLALPQIAGWSQRRARLDATWAAYDTALEGRLAVERAPSRPGADHGRYMYVVGTDDPARLAALLWREGVGSTRGAGIAHCLDPAGPAGYPGAARLRTRSLQIPFADGLSARDVRRVAAALDRCAEAMGR
jgi:dTDP-4-amino-4,6-dideoxygalactose transaminase